MSLITDYTNEEQMLLMQGPRIGAIVVSAASPGRSADLVSEGFAAIGYAMQRTPEFLDNSLINSILYQLDELSKAGQKFADYSKLAAAPGAEEHGLAQLGQIADILERKSNPAEAAGYKRWVLHAAGAASEAAKEGANFFGRGGVTVSDAEKAALERIAKALRVEG